MLSVGLYESAMICICHLGVLHIMLREPAAVATCAEVRSCSAVAMLACARIGAVHSVVFGGFSAESLSQRMADAK